MAGTVLGTVVFIAFSIGIASALAIGKKNNNSIGKCLIVGCVSAIVWIVLLVIAAYISSKTSNMFIYIIFAYFGWRFLNKIQPAMFIWMPFVGWIVYFVIKFVLSAIVGMFVTPIVISKKMFSFVGNMLE